MQAVERLAVAAGGGDAGAGDGVGDGPAGRLDREAGDVALRAGRPRLRVERERRGDAVEPGGELSERLVAGLVLVEDLTS